MLVSAVLGLVAAFVLSVEALALAADPLSTAACDLSEKVSCSAVGRSPQASLLGFPNAFLGLASEPVVITVAIAALTSARLSRPFLAAAQVFYTIGLLFAWWLFTQSYFVLEVLCPWCVLITVTTTTVFVALTRVNVRAGVFGETVREKLEKPLSYGADVAGLLLVVAVMAAAIIVRYL